jgi:hypothetical protein
MIMPYAVGSSVGLQSGTRGPSAVMALRYDYSLE